jgi:hypothetical protein
MQAQTDELSPEAAEFLLPIKLGEVDRRRMPRLAERSDAGTLKPEEQAEFDGYLHIGNLLAVMQSNARLALKRKSLDHARLPRTLYRFAAIISWRANMADKPFSGISLWLVFIAIGTKVRISLAPIPIRVGSSASSAYRQERPTSNGRGRCGRKRLSKSAHFHSNNPRERSQSYRSASNISGGQQEWHPRGFPRSPAAAPAA